MAAIMEREIKLGFRNADQAREAILATGATPLRGRRLQEDYLLDTPGDTLETGAACCACASNAARRC